MKINSLREYIISANGPAEYSRVDNESDSLSSCSSLDSGTGNYTFGLSQEKECIGDTTNNWDHLRGDVSKPITTEVDSQTARSVTLTRKSVNQRRCPICVGGL